MGHAGAKLTLLIGRNMNVVNTRKPAGWVFAGERRALRGLAGYTLMEVVVSVLVVATLATGFYGGLTSGFMMTESTREDLRATQIMTQKLEALRLCTWSELSSFSFQESYDPTAGTNQGTGTFYAGRVVVGPATNIPSNLSYSDKMRQVTVTVSWTNGICGKPLVHTRQAQTLVARYGLQNYIWGAVK